MQHITLLKLNFNPRSDERSDEVFACVFIVVYDFNPRSDERSDFNLIFFSSYPLDFNPRSDERSDSQSRWSHQYYRISIHAPTNGATILLSIIYHSL